MNDLEGLKICCKGDLRKPDIQPDCCLSFRSSWTSSAYRDRQQGLTSLAFFKDLWFSRSSFKH